jgi:integrase
MDHNPASLLPRGHGDVPKPRPAPDDVWHRRIEAAPPRERLMARLAGEAGMRRAEIARSCRDDLVRDRGGWSLIVKGKGDKRRVVPIGDDLALAIRMHCDRGYLFPGQISGHISDGWVGTVISALMPPGWTMHRLRHRFATHGYTAVGRDDIRPAYEAATPRSAKGHARTPDDAA